jgi:hypothetical protein
MKHLLLVLAVLVNALWPLAARAHIGSPNVFFDGQAGPYPLQVVIKPAEVIPGLAEISVRVLSGSVEKITALPIKWNAGRQGAPPPDAARPVAGETNLYYAELWFMEPGAQSVELEITGAAGVGRVVIPVDAVARRVLGMPKGLGVVLVFLSLILATLLLSIIGAAVRESVLAPGLIAASRRRWYARSAMAVAAVVLSVLIFGGKHWWDAEAADYRNNRLYRPLSASADVVHLNDRQVLRLQITDAAYSRFAPLVPDHGKLMHLFLIREPNLDIFAHLHPVKMDRNTFETTLPPIPGGQYRIYADVTYETGASDTVTTPVYIPEEVASSKWHDVASDPDDSWRRSPELRSCGEAVCRLSPELTMTRMTPGRLTVNRPVMLQFKTSEADGRPAALESYLGMRGHLALRRYDGSVFTHLHPGGSASMAAMQLAVFRVEGKLPLKAAFGADDPICQLPAATEREQGWISGNQVADGISFPYAFPRPGSYRLWVQVKVRGELLTGVYDLDVVAD